MRPSGRAPDQMRELKFEPGFTRHAEGSCLVSFGDTRVLWTTGEDNKDSQRFYDRLGIRREKKVYYVMDT